MFKSLVRVMPVAAILWGVAAMGSIGAASAGCVRCGCGLGLPGPAEAAPAACRLGDGGEPAPFRPPQPTFHVDQGPSYRVVVVAPDDEPRWLRFAHREPHPYIRTRYGHHWWTTRVFADDRHRIAPRRPHGAGHDRDRWPE